MPPECGPIAQRTGVDIQTMSTQEPDASVVGLRSPVISKSSKTAPSPAGCIDTSGEEHRVRTPPASSSSGSLSPTQISTPYCAISEGQYHSITTPTIASRPPVTDDSAGVESGMSDRALGPIDTSGLLAIQQAATLSRIGLTKCSSRGDVESQLRISTSSGTSPHVPANKRPGPKCLKQSTKAHERPPPALHSGLPISQRPPAASLLPTAVLGQRAPTVIGSSPMISKQTPAHSAEPFSQTAEIIGSQTGVPEQTKAVSRSSVGAEFRTQAASQSGSPVSGSPEQIAADLQSEAAALQLKIAILQSEYAKLQRESTEFQSMPADAHGKSASTKLAATITQQESVAVQQMSSVPQPIAAAPLQEAGASRKPIAIPRSANADTVQGSAAPQPRSVDLLRTQTAIQSTPVAPQTTLADLFRTSIAIPTTPATARATPAHPQTTATTLQQTVAESHLTLDLETTKTPLQQLGANLPPSPSFFEEACAAVRQESPAPDSVQASAIRRVTFADPQEEPTAILPTEPINRTDASPRQRECLVPQPTSSLSGPAASPLTVAAPQSLDAASNPVRAAPQHPAVAPQQQPAATQAGTEATEQRSAPKPQPEAEYRSSGSPGTNEAAARENHFDLNGPNDEAGTWTCITHEAPELPECSHPPPIETVMMLGADSSSEDEGPEDNFRRGESEQQSSRTLEQQEPMKSPERPTTSPVHALQGSKRASTSGIDRTRPDLEPKKPLNEYISYVGADGVIESVMVENTASDSTDGSDGEDREVLMNESYRNAVKRGARYNRMKAKLRARARRASAQGPEKTRSPEHLTNQNNSWCLGQQEQSSLSSETASTTSLASEESRSEIPGASGLIANTPRPDQYPRPAKRSRAAEHSSLARGAPIRASHAPARDGKSDAPIGEIGVADEPIGPNNPSGISENSSAITDESPAHADDHSGIEIQGVYTSDPTPIRAIDTEDSGAEMNEEFPTQAGEMEPWNPPPIDSDDYDDIYPEGYRARPGELCVMLTLPEFSQDPPELPDGQRGDLPDVIIDGDDMNGELCVMLQEEIYASQNSEALENRNNRESVASGSNDDEEAPQTEQADSTTTEAPPGALQDIQNLPRRTINSPVQDESRISDLQPPRNDLTLNKPKRQKTSASTRKSAKSSKPPARATGTAEPSVKEFPCLFCDEMFYDRSDRNYHHMVHRDEYEFECDTCCEKFLLKCALATHRRVHQSPKKIQCAQCRVPFPSASALMRHERVCSVDEGNLPSSSTASRSDQPKCKGGAFVCTACRQGFSSPTDLLKHCSDDHR